MRVLRAQPQPCSYTTHQGFFLGLLMTPVKAAGGTEPRRRVTESVHSQPGCLERSWWETSVHVRMRQATGFETVCCPRRGQGHLGWAGGRWPVSASLLLFQRHSFWEGVSQLLSPRSSQEEVAGIVRAQEACFFGRPSLASRACARGTVGAVVVDPVLNASPPSAKNVESLCVFAWTWGTHRSDIST